MAKDKPLTKGEVAEAAMRAANIVDAGLQGTLGYARLAARLQGATAAASQLGTPTNPLSTAYQMDAPLPGLPGAVTRRERSPFARR